MLGNNKKKSIFLVVIILFICSFSFTEDVGKIRQNIIESAKSYLGTPYAWGGSTRNGMDCSGFVMTAVKEGSGISLPRTTTEIFNYVDIIPFAKVEPGDLLFFKAGSSITHVAIFLGGNEFIHAPSEGPETGVVISDLNETYWKKYFYATGRFVAAAGVSVTNSSIGDKETPSPRETDKISNPKYSTRPTNSISDVNFTYDRPNQKYIALDLDFSVLYQLFDTSGYEAKLTGSNAFLKLKLLFDQYQFGVGAGVLVLEDSDFLKIPFFVTICVPYGFNFDIGAYIVSGEAKTTGTDKPLKKASFFANIGWQTPNVIVDGTSLALVQNIIWAGEFGRKNLTFGETFIDGLCFSTGIRINMGI